MNDASAQARALAMLELDDIFVLALNCRLERDYNQTSPIRDLRFQHRLNFQSEGITQKRTAVEGKQELIILRYFLDAGVQVIKPEVPADKTTFTEADILAEIHGTIAVDYVASKDPREDPEAIGAFGPNVVFHAWPYWRALVIDRASQMRLPRIVLPMLRQAAPQASAIVEPDSSKE